MPKAGSEATTPDSGFVPLVVLLGDWFERQFDDLPAKLQRLVARHFLASWDSHGPGQRRDQTLLMDIEHHPALAREREELWRKTQELMGCERIAANLPPENRTMLDVEMQRARLHELRAEIAALDHEMFRKAENLGLGRFDGGPSGGLRRAGLQADWGRSTRATGSGLVASTARALAKPRRRGRREQARDALVSLYSEGVDIHSPESVGRLQTLALDKAKITFSKSTFERALAEARSLISIKFPQKER